MNGLSSYLRAGYEQPLTILSIHPHLPNCNTQAQENSIGYTLRKGISIYFVRHLKDNLVMVTPHMAPFPRPVLSCSEFSHFKIKEAYWKKYIFKSTGLLHAANNFCSVYTGGSCGFTQFASRKWAENHHKAIFISNLILYSELWVSSDFVTKIYAVFLEINMKYENSLL